ncbi:zinc-ribbon domain-containing protein [Aliiroseovarius crassostreae]|nr:zinc-ribbon domain-containing protein [Aliiroseovarius crassostreae]UWQ04413.1 zinc-ribbon domain-containing protein [Aliiroseovarius crassostreae]
MRLVCPNCGAQYEVDDRVMPETGRDVQCSACGHAWFQRGAQMPEDTAEAIMDPAAIEAEEISQQEEPEQEPVSDPTSDSSATEETPPRRSLSPDVQAILQEEAQRELEARQSQQEQIETQTEMGLEDFDEEEAQRQSIRERMARLRGADDDFEATQALTEGRGRDLLPDIEEINSTLDAQQGDEIEQEGMDPATTKARSGFRKGFMLVVGLALILLLLYVYAPALAEAVPQIDPLLDSYVSAVDWGRMAIRSFFEGVILKLQGANSL